MDRLILTDTLTGETVRVVDWDFRNTSASEFKKNFKSAIQEPLRRLLNDFNKDPHVQMPEPLKESMLGLIRGLINFYYFQAPLPVNQKLWNLLEKIGNQTNNSKVAWIHFSSVTKAFKTCLSIVDAENRHIMPFIFMIRSVNEVRHVFSRDASFVSQMMRVHSGAVPGHFPLVVSWKIQELVPTTLPDTFMEAKVVSLFTEEVLKQTPTGTPDVSKESFLLNSLLADESLQVYAHGTCALCENSGVQRLARCSKCWVARYCGRECQTEHWSVHKQHCKRLLELRLEASRKAEDEEAA
jgi:hypothetical protein